MPGELEVKTRLKITNAAAKTTAIFFVLFYQFFKN